MISVTIIARDEADQIAGCIESAKKVSDDIVVIVDPRTTDNTAALARKLGARVKNHPFQDFASQKNFALSQAAGEWVLSLDADERVSDELAAEIKAGILSTDHDGFVIPRINYMFGRIVRHTNWSSGNDAHLWLFKKTSARWEGTVHEQAIVSGTVGHLKNAKIHHNYQSVDQFITKMNHYTSHEAARRKFNPLMVVVYPVWKFFRHYFLYAGFLDGWIGLFLSYLMAVYGLVIYVKAWSLRKT